MRLLISPVDNKEAQAAAEGGADIIDIKNPLEGSLGASYPWTIREVKESLPDSVELSATMGDLDHRPGHASLIALGISLTGVKYVKAGMAVRTHQEAQSLAKNIVRAVEDRGCLVILSAYADYRTIETVSPIELVDIAESAGAQGVMVDTYHKNSKTLFDHMPEDELQTFVSSAKEQRLMTALAGSIREEHIPKLKKLRPDIVGVRGAVCTEGDRAAGRIVKEKVKEFKKHLTSNNGRVV